MRSQFVVLCLALVATTGWAQESVLRLIDMKGTTSKPFVQHRKASDKQWYPAFVGTEGAVTDHFKTDPQTVAALEFFIGGRVGVARDTDLEIITDRSVSPAAPTIQRIVLHSGTLWMKSGGKLARPLEIQTNGGTMGIKGTEFTLETKPDSATKLAVLEGSVEVKDQNQKYLGVAQAGDVYSLKTDAEPQQRHVDIAELRRETNQMLLDTGIADVAFSIEDYKQEAAALRAGVSDASKRAQELLEKLNSLQTKDDRQGYYLAAPFQNAIRAGVSPSGGSRMSSPTALVPKAETLFAWKEYPGADGYVIFVSDKPTFENILYSDRVRDTRAVYPAVARPLAPGRYYWRIVPVSADDAVMPEAMAGQSSFEVSPSQ